MTVTADRHRTRLRRSGPVDHYGSHRRDRAERANPCQWSASCVAGGHRGGGEPVPGRLGGMPDRLFRRHRAPHQPNTQRAGAALTAAARSSGGSTPPVARRTCPRPSSRTAAERSCKHRATRPVKADSPAAAHPRRLDTRVPLQQLDAQPGERTADDHRAPSNRAGLEAPAAQLHPVGAPRRGMIHFRSPPSYGYRTTGEVSQTRLTERARPLHRCRPDPERAAGPRSRRRAGRHARHCGRALPAPPGDRGWAWPRCNHAAGRVRSPRCRSPGSRGRGPRRGGPAPPGTRRWLRRPLHRRGCWLTPNARAARG